MCRPMIGKLTATPHNELLYYFLASKKLRLGREQHSSADEEQHSERGHGKGRWLGPGVQDCGLTASSVEPCLS